MNWREAVEKQLRKRSDLAARLTERRKTAARRAVRMAVISGIIRN